MNIRSKFSAALLILSIGSIPASTALAQTKVALHATEEEIKIWNDRRVNGPYKSGYDRILANASAFRSSPNGAWTGQTVNACWDRNPLPNQQRDVGLRDAAFIYMLTGDTSYRTPVLKQLLAQAAMAGTDFSNTTRWCKNSTWYTVANWVRILVNGYSYIRSSLSGGDQATIDAFFSKAAAFQVLHNDNILELRFPNRDNDDYAACTGSGSNCPGNTWGSQNGLLYFGGPTIRLFHTAWQSQMSSRMAMVTAVGAVIGSDHFKERGLRFFKEWVKYATYPDGSQYDMVRWYSGGPGHSYGYKSSALGAIISIADHLARAGDTSAYDYTTSEGMYGTEGGPKSLRKVLQHFAGLTNGSIIKYASQTATTDPGKVVDSQTPDGNRISWLWVANNNYYKDPAVAATYSRTIPSSFLGAAYNQESGEHGTYPDIRFMFGQMEGKVWPYPSTGATVIGPIAPTNLSVNVPG